MEAAPPPDATVVSAWVPNIQRPVGEAEVTGGSYFLRVFQYGNESFASITISFKVGSSAAPQTARWVALEVTELNLTVDQ